MRHRPLSSRTVPLLVAVVVLVALSPLSALTAFAAPDSQVLRVSALIDGRSRLILQGDTAQWLHLIYAAPGRHEFRDEPTLLGGASWFPRWPDLPDRENRNCGCTSDVFQGLAPALPRTAMTLEVRSVEGRGITSIVQQPMLENGWTLIIDFDDVGYNGSEWYVAEIVFRALPTPFAHFAVPGLVLHFDRAPHGGDRFQLSGEFSLGATSDGLAPESELLVVGIGPGRLELPAGSLQRDGSRWTYWGPLGASADDVVNAGEAAIRLEQLDAQRFAITIAAAHVDLHGTANPAQVFLALGNDEGTTATDLEGRLGSVSGLPLPAPR
jgi:hypothetical protein